MKKTREYAEAAKRLMHDMNARLRRLPDIADFEAAFDTIDGKVTSGAAPKDIVANWNKNYPVNTRVRFWTGIRKGDGHEGRTWVPACLMANIPVVYIRDTTGKNVGAVALSHVEPLHT